MERLENLYAMFPKEVSVEDIRPIVPQAEESVIVLQRNARDSRDTSSADFGALTQEAFKQTQVTARVFFESVFQHLSSQEREKTDVLVIGSNVTLTIPDGNKSEHQRGTETATVVIEELKKVMEELSINEENLINSFAIENGGPMEAMEMKDLKIMEDDPAFVDYLREKYGTGKEFWIKYECDIEKEKREKLKAEGPEDIAKRMKDYLSLLSNLSNVFHKANPDRRLIIWAVSHYDSISPFLKDYVTKVGIDPYLGVDSGGGISMKIDKEGKTTTKIDNNEYEVEL